MDIYLKIHERYLLCYSAFCFEIAKGKNATKSGETEAKFKS